MVTGTITYNTLRKKTPKERILTQKKCKYFKFNKTNAASIGRTAVKPYVGNYKRETWSVSQIVIDNNRVRNDATSK